MRNWKNVWSKQSTILKGLECCKSEPIFKQCQCPPSAALENADVQSKQSSLNKYIKCIIILIRKNLVLEFTYNFY